MKPKREDSLSPRAREAWLRLAAAAAEANLPEIRITSGLRSDEDQAKLYAQGRSAPGRIVTKRDGVKRKSVHQVGDAFDVVFMDPTTGKHTYEGPWDELGALAAKAGLEWGGTWKKFPDRPHFQVAGSDLWSKKKSPTGGAMPNTLMGSMRNMNPDEVLNAVYERQQAADGPDRQRLEQLWNFLNARKFALGGEGLGRLADIYGKRDPSRYMPGSTLFPERTGVQANPVSPAASGMVFALAEAARAARNAGPAPPGPPPQYGVPGGSIPARPPGMSDADWIRFLEEIGADPSMTGAEGTR